MLAQFAHDFRRIVRRGFADDLHIFGRNIGRALAHHLLDGHVRHRSPAEPRQGLPRLQHALVSAVLLREALLQHRLAVVNRHDNHGAVADVAQHVRPGEFPQFGNDGGIALRVHVHANQIDMVVDAAPVEIYMPILRQIGAEPLALVADPRQRQSDRQMNSRRGQLIAPKLLPDARQRQQVVILIADLIERELPMPRTDDVILAIVHQHVLRVRRFSLAASNARRKNAVRRLDVPVAVIQPDDVDFAEYPHILLTFSAFAATK